MIEHLNFETFNDKLIDSETNKFKNDKPSVIKFSAPWCAPCRFYTPIFEEISKEMSEANFYSVDVDDEPEISNMFSVRSIPTTVFLPIEGKSKSYSGTLPYSKLKRMVEEIL
jgi:thioredoxin 1